MRQQYTETNIRPTNPTSYTSRTQLNMHLQSTNGYTPATYRLEYPSNVIVDFTKLRANVLHKYMAYHQIQAVPGSSKYQLAAAVASHFNQECKQADEDTSITSFINYITRDKKRFCANYDEEQSIHKKSSSLFEMYEKNSYNDEMYEEISDRKRKSHEIRHIDSPDGPLKHTIGYNNRHDHKRNYSIDETKVSRNDFDQDGTDEDENGSGKKKKRKVRLYCVCKGSSFGDMIACDNKKCLDRTNWYHMKCVGLDSSMDPPETWYCPSCEENDPAEIPEHQYRKPVASVTYGDMISHALEVLPEGKATFKEICDFVEKQYESQLNWKLESDQRKSPVWKSSVRKILFSNMRFRKHPEDKGLFCLAA